MGQIGYVNPIRDYESTVLYAIDMTEALIRVMKNQEGLRVKLYRIIEGQSLDQIPGYPFLDIIMCL